MSGPSPRSQPSGLSPMDGLLVLMVIAWGANYSLLKRAFEEIPPAAFNTLRMAFSSAVFLAAIWFARRQAGRSAAGPSSVFYTPHALTSRDRWDLAVARPGRALPVSALLRRRARAHERVERGADLRRVSGRRGHHDRRDRARARRAAALARRGAVHRRHLLRRRSRRRDGRRHVVWRPAHARAPSPAGRSTRSAAAGSCPATRRCSSRA